MADAHITPNQLVEGKLYWIYPEGWYEYQGIDHFMGESSYKFVPMRRGLTEYLLNLDRVYLQEQK